MHHYFTYMTGMLKYYSLIIYLNLNASSLNYKREKNCVLSNVSEKTKNKIHKRLHSQSLLYQNMKILIIGAGIAGLAAALSLYEKGFTEISVLEAQDYVGGRVLSSALGDNILELGAQWIHGTNNYLYDFSVTNNLLCDSSDEPSFEGEGLFCTSNGEIVKMSIVKEVKDVFAETKFNLDEGNCNNCFARSVESFFSESFNSYISSCLDESLNSIRKGLFNWLLKFEVIDNACDNLGEVAVQSYSEWCDIPDESYHINFKNGFSSLANAIQCQLPSRCLYLKKPIKCINWKKKLVLSHFNEKFFHCRSTDDFPVLVECENGEDIAFDAVILTASVGYIKENIDTLFKPPLPIKKARAFNNIGFGTINKIYLIYEIPFWKIQDKGFQLVWTSLDEELKVLLKEHPWINGITGFDIVQKQPNVLLGWIGGIEAKMIENIDVDTVSSVVTKLLRKFLHSPDIPFPIKTIRTCWFSNNYIRGAYSYRSLKFYESGSELEDLRSPLYSTYEITGGKTFHWPAVYFAGEALDENSFSSVHGAFQSGMKVADNIHLMCSQIKDIINWCDVK